MSSNIEDPPKIDDTLSLPPIKTIRTTPLSPISSGVDNKKDIVSTNAEGAVTIPGDAEDEECKTPTSVEHKIPEPLNCPPAPRKPCLGKRKASSELIRPRFFKEVNMAEVEDLFRRYDRGRLINDSSSREVVKRRRSSCNSFVVQFR